MLSKNQTITAAVESLGTGGEGIVRHEGVTFFVPYCLPEEQIRFLSLKVKDGIGYGKLQEVLSPSPDRVEPRCPAFFRCGGCRLQHMSYLKQLEFKGKLVRDSLKKIAGIETDVPAAVHSGREYGYRNKLQLPVGTDANGNTVIGFYAERSHRIVPIDACAIHPDWSEKLIAAVYRYTKECGVSGYDEVKRTGELRHVVVREISGRYLVTLVSATEKLPKIETFAKLLKGIFGEFTLYINLNRSSGNAVFGEKFILVCGQSTFQAEEGGILYEAGPKTFLQVNEGVRNELYRAAIGYAAPTGDEVVIDAYSGGGLMTAMLAKRCKRVYGIELIEESVACANALKEKNGLKNMTNICGKVEEKLVGVLKKEQGEKLRLIVDPPRAGLARSVANVLKDSGIERIVLISCNPATLARDLGILTGTLVETEQGLQKTDGASGNYKIDFIQPYDMFPQTKWVETLVVLSKKGKNYAEQA